MGASFFVLAVLQLPMMLLLPPAASSPYQDWYAVFSLLPLLLLTVQLPPHLSYACVMALLVLVLVPVPVLCFYLQSWRTVDAH
jgi:hypothetical protein